MSQTALVLFSGGQDSATCLAWALEKFQRVETIGFDYHQRHKNYNKRIYITPSFLSFNQISKNARQVSQNIKKDN